MRLDKQASELWLAHHARLAAEIDRGVKVARTSLAKPIGLLQRAWPAGAAVLVSSAFVGVAVVPGYWT